MTATFYKTEGGTVILTVVNGSITSKYSLTPGRDVVPSSDGTKVVIDFMEYSDRALSFLPSELKLSASSPAVADPVSVADAIEKLGTYFFFDVGTQQGTSPKIEGGQMPFIADGSTDTVIITHSLGSVPDYFSLTTTQPITANHLNRTVTFPNNSTMLITFGVAPLPGEDANYVYTLFKNP